jgi:hypothetical protein
VALYIARIIIDFNNGIVSSVRCLESGQKESGSGA